MPRKPRYFQPAESGTRERWLVSYTDVMTILLILFVSVAAKGVHRTPPPTPPTVPRAEPVTPLQRAKIALEQGGLHPRLEARGLVISLPQTILFPSGEDTIAPSALPTITQVGRVLAGMPNRVMLAGYADAVPIHNQRFRSNWELSAARALALLKLLSTGYGIDEARLSVASYGSFDPRQPNDTEAGRAENRRVEIVIEAANL